MPNYGNQTYGDSLYGSSGSFPHIGPYALATTMPEVVAGVDDGNSLLCTGLVQSGNYWYPKVRSGRYIVSGENTFRYFYNAPQTLSTIIQTGVSSYSIPLNTALFSPESFALAPTQMNLGSTIFIPILNTIRWCLPVPSGASILAGDFVSPRYITGQSDNSTNSLSANSSLWYMPTYGGKVLAVNRSRNPRSFDVLADEDSYLYEVEYPDELTNDRVYCHDKQSGVVYGLYPNEKLPPPPYSTGLYAQTYVSLSIPLDSLTETTSGDIQYRANYQTFFDSYEGGSGYTFFDPLRCEEISFVDTDGFIRLRHTGVANKSPIDPKVLYISPSSWMSCTTQTVSGNAIDALLPDPTNGNSLARLPYGTTVLVRYYVNDSFCLESVSSSGGVYSAHFRVLATASGTASATYETSVYNPHYTQTDNKAPNLNPLTSQVSSGFLYLEDSNNPTPVPIASLAKLILSTSHPIMDRDYLDGELIVVRAIPMDSQGIEIVGVPLSLILSSTHYSIINTSPSNSVSSLDGSVLYYIRANSLDTSPLTISLVDNRNSSNTLVSAILVPEITGGSIYPAPSITTQSWEPSVFISQGEEYQQVQDSYYTMIRISAIQPDGFPWLSNMSPGGDFVTDSPGILSITSSNSSFIDPSTNVALGSIVQSSLNDSGVLSLGYIPVPGDILHADLYIADFKYSSTLLL